MMTQQLRISTVAALALCWFSFGCGSSHHDNAPPPVAQAPLPGLVGHWLSGCVRLPAPDDLRNESRQYVYDFAANGRALEQETGYADAACTKATTKQVITYDYSTGDSVAGSPGAVTLDMTRSQAVLTLLDPSNKGVPDLCAEPGQVLAAGRISSCDANDVYQIVKVDAKVLYLGIVEADLGSPSQRPVVLDQTHPLQSGT